MTAKTLREEIPYRHIAVEGVFRSGKSKLAGLIAQRLNARIVHDKADNPYLKDFYDEKEGASFLAQLVFLINRYHQQARLVQRDLFEDRIVSDYLFEKDKIYAYQTLTDDELVVYERIYSILTERVPRPDFVVYLQISVPTLTKRIAKEGNLLEKNISEKYLEDIVEAYDYFFFNYQATPLLVVKADELDFSREEDLFELLDQVKLVKKSPLFYVPLSRSNRSVPRS